MTNPQPGLCTGRSSCGDVVVMLQVTGFSRLTTCKSFSSIVLTLRSYCQCLCQVFAIFARCGVLQMRLRAMAPVISTWHDITPTHKSVLRVTQAVRAEERQQEARRKKPGKPKPKITLENVAHENFRTECVVGRQAVRGRDGHRVILAMQEACRYLLRTECARAAPGRATANGGCAR